MQLKDLIDDHYREVSGEYERYLASRTVLDLRTRRLAAIGQCTAMGETDELEELLRAVHAENSARFVEVREAILQACVYVGRPRMNRALQSLRKVVTDLDWQGAGVHAAADRGPAEERELGREKKQWRVSTAQFPERDSLVEQYGWKGMSMGLTYQPNNFPSAISRFHTLDEGFAQKWLDFVHEGMYARRFLDHKTRTLVMIADCIGVNELSQAVLHMANALDIGATRQEVYEICIQSTQYAGDAFCPDVRPPVYGDDGKAQRRVNQAGS